MSAFHRTGEGLDADVIGSAVSADGEEFEFGVQFPPPAQGSIARFDAADSGGAVFKSAVDERISPSGIWIDSR